MAFATSSDLATRLQRSFTAAEAAAADALLADATGYLQAEIGQLVERGTRTVELRFPPCGSPIRLPQQPVVSVASVTLNGSAITDWVLDSEGRIHRDGGWPADTDGFTRVAVVFTFGVTDVPAELRTWCCVLAAGALAQSARGTLSPSGVASERIDDYSISYEPGTATFSIPEIQLQRLRSRWGSGAAVTR